MGDTRSKKRNLSVRGQAALGVLALDIPLLYRIFSINATKCAEKTRIFSRPFSSFSFTSRRANGILCNRKLKPQDSVRVRLHTPAAKHGRFFMSCCNQGNATLWILIALLVLGSKDGAFSSSVMSGCGLPIMLALLFCLYRNGTLASLLTPSCGGCNCGC